MDYNQKLCPDKICRTCLTESSDMKSLGSKIQGEHRTLLEVLSFVADIDIKTNNKLPKQVCSVCEAIMCKADAFKRRCLESENFLNQHVHIENTEENTFKKYEKTAIKNEVPIEIDKNSIKLAPQSLSDLEKPSNSEDIQLYLSTEDDEKSKIFSDISKTCPVEFDTSDAPSNSKDDKTCIKEESFLEFPDDSQDNSYDNVYEELPITFEEQKNSIKFLKVYSCSCSKVFNNKELYKAHLQEENCDGYKKSMKIRMEKKGSNRGRTITIKRQIICPECNLEFKTLKECKLHRASKHNSAEVTGDFECTMCLRKFSRKSSYTNHMKLHNLKANLKFTCDICKREFQYKAHLDNHILHVHTREKGFPCDECGLNFNTQETLDLHKESHNQKVDKKHQCHICKKSFIMLSTLTDHLRTHTGEKPYLCSICGRGFSQKTNLAQHMRRHQGLKPFKCEDCERRFVSKGELVAHTRKHSGAHPFVCDDCGSGFTTSSSLVKHRRIHTGERPYACDMCPMRFSASGTLKNHRRTHTGERPFQCSYCEKAFVQRHDLISHIRCHTGERPYTCGCGQAFRKASALKTHVKMHGKNDLVPTVGPMLGHCEAQESLASAGKAYPMCN